MAASNTRFTQNSLGQSKNPIDSDHGIYRERSRFGRESACPPISDMSGGCQNRRDVPIGCITPTQQFRLPSIRSVRLHAEEMIRESLAPLPSQS